MGPVQFASLAQVDMQHVIFIFFYFLLYKIISFLTLSHVLIATKTFNSSNIMLTAKAVFAYPAGLCMLACFPITIALSNTQIKFCL